MTSVLEHGKCAKAASIQLAQASSAIKSNLLFKMAELLELHAEDILEANEKDMASAKAGNVSSAMLDRLRLTKERILGMAEGVRNVALLDDPVGKTLSGSVRPNGMKINKVTVPLGVIAMIYEARPNVTSDAAALCIKAGNAVILRGGSEALYSNTAIVKVLRQAAEQTGITPDIIRFIEDTSRDSATQLMKMNAYVDVLIPRGGAGLIRSVVENATVPVIETASGNCHIYIDDTADIQMAIDIVENAKVSRPGVCNACETLLIHKDIVEDILPKLAKVLMDDGVELHGDELAKNIVPEMSTATEEDWRAEYLDLILAVKVVYDIDEAIEHVEKYSTGHSEAIITQTYQNAQAFQHKVDSSTVYVNVSTRFTDGGEFGLGAEIGISTQKLHARGPVGLAQLVTTKFLVDGFGQIR